MFVTQSQNNFFDGMIKREAERGPFVVDNRARTGIDLYIHISGKKD